MITGVEKKLQEVGTTLTTHDWNYPNATFTVNSRTHQNCSIIDACVRVHMGTLVTICHRNKRQLRICRSKTDGSSAPPNGHCCERNKLPEGSSWCAFGSARESVGKKWTGDWTLRVPRKITCTHTNTLIIVFVVSKTSAIFQLSSPSENHLSPRQQQTLRGWGLERWLQACNTWPRGIPWRSCNLEHCRVHPIASCTASERTTSPDEDVFMDTAAQSDLTNAHALLKQNARSKIISSKKEWTRMPGSLKEEVGKKGELQQNFATNKYVL